MNTSEFERRCELSAEESETEVAALLANCAKERSTSLSLEGYHRFDSLAPIADFHWLEILDCSGTLVSDLRPLSGLGALAELNCSGAKVSDLGTLSDLGALKSLDCSSTDVSDLGPLSRLGALRKLVCHKTMVTDLSPLSELLALTRLNFSNTDVSDLGSLSRLSALAELNCSLTEVSDLGPLSGLGALTRLNFYITDVSDLGPLSGLSALSELRFFATKVSDLGPLSGLAGLTRISCFATKVSDLSPLSGLDALIELNFFGTDVSDLTPISGLSALIELNCSKTKITDLSPLSGLRALSVLSCFGILASDLSPLSGLSALTELDCSNTNVSDLGPLSNVGALTKLDCSNTDVSDLGPLSELHALAELDCYTTKVSDLGPLSALGALAKLDSDNTQIVDLRPLSSVCALARLSCSRTTIDAWPKALFGLPHFETLIATDARIDRIPREELSQKYADNCLPNIRAYFADLDAGAAPLERSKVILLGNGQVGKTQLRRWLLNSDAMPLPYDPAIPSTHGIEVLRGPLALPSGDALDVSVWDFGGQDIYHGTHSLFMKTRAIFVLCWSAEQEDNREQLLDGLIHQNRPMAYWVDYVRQLAGPDNPLIIVQTQCDAPGQRQHNRFVDLDLTGFESHNIVQFSAQTELGGAALREAIGEAAEWIKDRHGVPLIGKGRLTVLNELEAWRSEDALREPTARQHKMMTQEEFRVLCEQAGGISSPPHLLNFLHHAGVIFYRPGLFDDRIILDQDWALDAIYAVFNRDNCFRRIKRAQGRFRREDIAETAWRNYGLDEQRLFLSMMESCGIAFTHYRYGDRDGDAEYIAPELLPPREQLAAQIESRWQGGEVVEARLRYGLLHHGLIRQIVARIGGEARIFGEYWQTGVLFFEQHRQSVAMIEAVADAEGWGGEIVISCRNGRAAELADLLVEEADKIGQSVGMTAESKPDRARPAPEHRDEEKPEPAPLSAGAHPSAAGKWYVSYAWGDGTPEGREREARVNALCDEAKARGIEIVRDRDAIRNGESIHRFMDALADGDRIIAILSDKYLHSPYCMYELFHAWLKQQANPDLFAKAVRAYRVPCAKFGTPAERGIVGKHWDDLVESTKPYVGTLAGRDLQEFNLYKHFALSAGDILYAINDTVVPRDWEDFLNWAFGD